MPIINYPNILENYKDETEKELVEKLLSIFNKSNIYSKKMNTTIDGYPDIFLSKGKKFLLCEAKDKDISENRSLKDVYKITQPPFYLNFLNSSEPLFSIVRIKDGLIYVFRITKALAKNIRSISLSEVHKYTDELLITKDLKEAAKWLEFYLR